jgi:hypothetical protein
MTPAFQDFVREDGKVDLPGLLRTLPASRTEIVEVLGLTASQRDGAEPLEAAEAQRALRGLVEVLVRVAPWTGSVSHAFAWFTSQRLPSFGQQTAADLFRAGKSDAIRAYVSRVAAGGYA